MPRVRTIPSANSCRNLAGRVSRFLSSIVCSNSPRSIAGPRSYLPLSSTVNHVTPLVHSKKAFLDGGEGRSLPSAAGSVQDELPLVGAATRQHRSAAAGAERDALLDRLSGPERVREARG